MRVTEQQTPGNESDSTPGRRLPPNSGSSARKRPEQAKVPPGKTWLWFVLILLANFLLGKFLIPSPETPVTVPYTFFKLEVGKHNVAAIYSQGDTITGRYTTSIIYPPLGEKGTRGSSGEAKTKSEKNPTPGGEAKSTDERSGSTGSSVSNNQCLHDNRALFRRPWLRTILNYERGRNQCETDSRRWTTPGRRSFLASARVCSSSAFISGSSVGLRSKAAA